MRWDRDEKILLSIMGTLIVSVIIPVTVAAYSVIGLWAFTPFVIFGIIYGLLSLIEK